MIPPHIDLTALLSNGERRSALGGRPVLNVCLLLLARPLPPEKQLPGEQWLQQVVAGVGGTDEGRKALCQLGDRDVMLSLLGDGPAAGNQCTIRGEGSRQGTSIVSLRHDLPDYEAEVTAVHEFGHILQLWNIDHRGLKRSREISDAVLTTLVREGDSAISAQIHAWQRLKQGDPRAWNQSSRESHGLSPVCEALDREVATGREADCDETKRAMFRAWMVQSGGPVYYENDRLQLGDESPEILEKQLLALPICARSSLADIVRTEQGTSYLDGIDFHDPYLTGFWSRPRGNFDDPEQRTAAADAGKAWRVMNQHLLLALSTLQDLREPLHVAYPQDVDVRSAVNFVYTGDLNGRVLTGLHKALAAEDGEDVKFYRRVARDFGELAPRYPVLAEPLTALAKACERVGAASPAYARLIAADLSPLTAAAPRRAVSAPQP